jgi:DNA-binding SARP family transcriptional activator
VLEFRILGPLEVVAEAGPVRLGGPRQRATLAILLLNANRVVSIDRLADDLYAGAPPVTAVTQVQRQISELRKALASTSVIETRSPGYVIRVGRDELDLNRFERLAAEGIQALQRGDAQRASDELRGALALWRGAALADLAYESFSQSAIGRLDELRLAVVEQRIEAELIMGRHAELIGELEELVALHPLRERLHGQLMLALYRSSRQVEALDVYRRTRDTLVADIGIEPTMALQNLERAILKQDPSLDLGRATSAPEPDRSVLVLLSDEDRVSSLLALAEPLAASAAKELIVVRLLADESELGTAASAVSALRTTQSVRTRTAAFTTLDPAGDVVRLANAYDVELVLMNATTDLEANQVPAELGKMLEHSAADVGVLAGAVDEIGTGASVFVPFGGGEHDWAALELGAWLASAKGAALHVVGTKADPRRGQRDASRLLADASLAVQRIVGVETEPVLAEPTEQALVAAVEPATLVVVGISPRWRQEGIGAARRALVRSARPPTLLVHGGRRPGGLAPRESRTCFTWSLQA